MAALGKWSHTADVITALPDGARDLATGTTIVTGANTGIGKETAGALASLGGRVVFACRGVDRGEQAIEDMRQKYPGKIAAACCISLDLSSLDGVAKFVREFRERAAKEAWPPLKCLVLNAGIFALGDTATQRSADGYEMTFAVNHLGHFLLTRLLLPELKAAKPSRVVVVASEAHSGSLLTTELTDKTALLEKVAKHVPAGSRLPSTAPMMPYSSSKLCNVLFARELFERQEAAGVTACSLHPGSAIATDIGRGNGIVNFLMKHVMSWVTKDVNQGASTTVFCALAPHDSLKGGYFNDCASAPEALSKHAKGEEGKAACVALWELSEELCKARL